MSRRKRRHYEHTCFCDAYKFPHRFGGGKCTGICVVEEQWRTHYGSGVCKHCPAYNRSESEPYCEVANQQESISVCRALQDFVEYNEIRTKK